MSEIYHNLGATSSPAPPAAAPAAPAAAVAPAANSTTPMMISSGVGTGLQIVGQVWSAIQAARMGDYNAATSRANAQAQAYQLQTTALQHERLAQIAAYDMTLSADAAAFREARLREQAAQVQGLTAARIGASGLGMVGSPLAVLDANARNAEMAVLVSNYQATLEQAALREEQRQHQYAALLARYGSTERLRLGEQQADMSLYESGNTVRGNILGATGSAVTGYQRFETARLGIHDARGRYADTTP